MVRWLVAAALAQAADQRFPNQRPAREPELGAMLFAADAYWDRRGVPLPCPAIAVDVADGLAGLDLPDGANGRGFSPLFGERV